MQKLGLAIALVVLFSQFSVALVGVAETAGGKIVFYSERNGTAEIYVMNADGTEPTRLTTNRTNEFCPDWSPEGTQIVFESDRDDPRPVRCFPSCLFKLYVMNADGTGERRLMDLPGTEGHSDWSPDGRRIVFQADRDENGKSEIYTVPAEGGEPQLVIGDGFDNTAPDWSPDGATIAFSSNRDGGLDIFVIGIDGTGLRKIIDTGMNDYFPDWSPDGREILFFAANWPSVLQDIYVVGADGSGLRQLTDAPSTAEESGQWSSDGTRIVYQTNRDGNFEIYSMGPNGGDVARLTQNRSGDYWPDMWLPAVAEQSPAEEPTTSPESSALGAAQEIPAEASLSDPEASALRCRAAARQLPSCRRVQAGRRSTR